MASLPGVREARRTVGGYELTIDDYRNRRQFPDQIGVFNKSIDIHAKGTRAPSGSASAPWRSCLLK